MAELTINTLIKVIIGVFVIVAVIGVLYLGMNNYVIPYFEGFGFGDENVGVIGGSADVCDGKEIVGTIGGDDYFWIEKEDGEGEKTKIYFDEEKVMQSEKFWGVGWANPDSEVGKVIGFEIDMYDSQNHIDYWKDLKDTLIGGNQICRK